MLRHWILTLVCLLIGAQMSMAQMKHLDPFVQPIKSIAMDDPALLALAKAVHQERLLYVGEVALPQVEGFETQAVLFQLLVERHGWRHLMLPLPPHVVLRLQTALATPSFEATAVMNELNRYKRYYSPQMRSFLAWLHQWNQTHPANAVHLYGFAHYEAQKAADFIPTHPHDYSRRTDRGTDLGPQQTPMAYLLEQLMAVDGLLFKPWY